MSDDITTEQLRAYRSRTEWGALVRHEICHRAADTIERLTRERDHLAQALTEANRAIEKIAKERDEARAAALREAASVRGWWLGVDGHGEPDGTYCSVKPSDDPNARLYVNAESILALIDKQAPGNG